MSLAISTAGASEMWRSAPPNVRQEPRRGSARRRHRGRVPVHRRLQAVVSNIVNFPHRAAERVVKGPLSGTRNTTLSAGAPARSPSRG